jgi:signal transduction histidine kinase
MLRLSKHSEPFFSNLLGGRLKIESAAGAGTLLTAELPLKTSHQRRAANK